MNNDRRQRIAKITERLEAITQDLDELADEERDAYENMPEGLQQSQRGEAAEEALSCLENARDSITDVTDYLESAAK